MAMKFYKKMQPTTDVVLANNTGVKFTTLDHLLGWFATDSEYVQNEFARLMAENRYGMSEVTWEEFEREYVKKKKSGTLRPPSREEFSGMRRQGSNLVETLGVAAVERAVAVNTTKEAPVTMADASPPTGPLQPLSAATPEGAFKPPVGRRNRRKT